MTFPQYKNLITFIANKLNWDISVTCSPISGEIQEDLSPLFTFNRISSNSDDNKPSNKVVTIKDIENLNEMLK